MKGNMTDEEFKRIMRHMKSAYGIDMTEKKEIIGGRMENYLRRGGWKSYSDYMDDVENDQSGKLEKELVNLLTTNHTFFMREFEHFDFLRTEVLPWLKQKEQGRKDLGIWCGAASSGEEPYMLAMLLVDFFGLEHKFWDTTVLATDISTEVLQTATAGIYTKDKIESLPQKWQRRFLKAMPDGEHYQMTPEIKQEVLFRKFNLMDPFPFKRKLHVILLRNVMIYFDQPTKQDLVKRVYDALVPGGYFFVGRTETINRGTVPFEIIQPSIFRKPL